MNINREVLKGINFTKGITKAQKEEILKLINGSEGNDKDILFIYYLDRTKIFQCTCGETGIFRKGSNDTKCPKCNCEKLIEIDLDYMEGGYLIGYNLEKLQSNKNEIKVEITPYGLMNYSNDSFDFDIGSDLWTLTYNKDTKEFSVTDYLDYEVDSISELYTNEFYSSEGSYLCNNQLSSIFKEIVQNIELEDYFYLNEMILDLILKVKAPIYRDYRIKRTCLKKFNNYMDDSIKEIDNYLNELRSKNVIDIDKDNIEEAFGVNDIRDVQYISNLDEFKISKDFDRLILKNKLDLYLDYFKETKNVDITLRDKINIIKLTNKANVDFYTMIKHIFRGINNENLTLNDIIYSLEDELRYRNEYPIDFSKPYSSKIKLKREFYEKSDIDKDILDKISKKPTLDTIYKALIG